MNTPSLSAQTFFGNLSTIDRQYSQRSGCYQDSYTVRLVAGERYEIKLKSREFNTYSRQGAFA